MIATSILAYPLPWLGALLILVAAVLFIYARTRPEPPAPRGGLSDADIENDLYPHLSNERRRWPR